MLIKKLKKIFLTGATGKLGSYLYPLLKKEFKVLGVGNKNKKIKKINLVNEKKLFLTLNKFNPNIIIHLAALTNVDFCEKNPLLTYKTNILSTINLVNWCLLKKKRIRFIYISTDQIYNNKKINFESSKLNSLNFYSFSKICAENSVSNLSNSIILRTNFFGHFPSKKDSLINWLLNMIKKRKKISLIKDIIFNPLYVETLCKYIKKIILKNDVKGIYNLGSKNSISKGRFLKEIANKLGYKDYSYKFVNSNEINFYAKRPKNMYMSVDKIEKKLNIKMPLINEELINFKNSFEKKNAI